MTIIQCALLAENTIGSLKKGGLNVLVGMLTVFLVLIIIILLLNMFKIFPYLEAKKAVKAVKSEEVTEAAIDQVISQIDRQEQEELVNDNELAAVITAAIYAAMGDAVPADGLIVRSIRKVNSRRRNIA